MLLCVYEMGVDYYFRFDVKTAENRDILSKYMI